MYYDPDFWTAEDTSETYSQLWKATPWKTTPKINRWVCLMEHQTSINEAYQYRDAPSQSIPFSKLVESIGQKASDWYEKKTGRRVEFNVCLLNYYEDGRQRIGWHSDREEVGRDTPVASISLGAKRSFLIRSKTDGMHDRTTIGMEDGSLILMENQFQMDYLHSVPREPEVTAGRINLTFRCKNESTAGEAVHKRRDEWLHSIVEGVEPDDNQYRAPNESNDRDVAVFGDNSVSTRIIPNNNDEPIQFMVTTNLGAEGYCAAELMELLSDHSCWIVALPLELHGCVAVYGQSSDPVLGKLLQSRSAHHVLRYHTHFSLEDLTDEVHPLPKDIPADKLYSFVKDELVSRRLYIGSVANSESFRVTCERIGGPHAFQSHQVELYVR